MRGCAVGEGPRQRSSEGRVAVCRGTQRLVRRTEMLEVGDPSLARQGCRRAALIRPTVFEIRPSSPI